MDYTNDEIFQADFYGVSVDVIRKKMLQNDSAKEDTRPITKSECGNSPSKVHRIIVWENGKPKGKIVSAEELKELNTPKFNSHKGKYDADRKRFGSHFKVRNTIFGNV